LSCHTTRVVTIVQDGVRACVCLLKRFCRNKIHNKLTQEWKWYKTLGTGRNKSRVFQYNPLTLSWSYFPTKWTPSVGTYSIQILNRVLDTELSTTTKLRARWLDNWVASPGRGKRYFPFSTVSRPALRHTLPLIQLVPWVKRPWIDAKQLTPLLMSRLICVQPCLQPFTHLLGVAID
jgi:hypothetical protein